MAKKRDLRMSKKIIIEGFGGAEQLKVIQEQVGEPGPNEVRIAHKALRLEFHRHLSAHGALPRCPCRIHWAQKPPALLTRLAAMSRI